jgi:hypothetical protein
MRSTITLWLIGMALPLQALAQEAPRWYQVEILFFRNLAGNAQFEEQWSRRGSITRTGTSYQLPGTGESAPGSQQSTEPQAFRLATPQSERLEDWGDLPTPANDQATSAPPNAPRFTEVPAGERVLTGANNRLNNRQDYRVISYHAWRQPLPADQKPLIFHVATGNNNGSNSELEGYIELSLKHYLHVDTELWWSEAGSNDSGDDTLSPTAHLLENRRMRSTETNYLDHPLIGVLIHIIPLDK